MNFYKRHLGDYAKDAGHLSLLEHGAYTLLLDRYYTGEGPIPKADVHRVTRARSRAEKAATDAVLVEFFILEAGAYRNRRADEELAKYVRQRDVNRELGKRGGRPKASSEITDSVSDSETESITESEPNRNPSQNPESRSQEPRALPTSQESETSRGLSLSAPTQARERDTPEPSLAGQACRAMRDAGCPLQQLNPSHPGLIAALDEGVTPATLADTVREAVAGGKSKPFAWAIATARDRRSQTRPATDPEAIHRKNRDVADAWLREQAQLDAAAGGSR